ncbi:MAG TPA: hypothetical protein VG651_13640 [Stellaceae bacterium]|nr:hypothetical protein [Stellaceae bacterium]
MTTAAIFISGTGDPEGDPSGPRCTGARPAERALGTEAQTIATTSSNAPVKRHARIADP